MTPGGYPEDILRGYAISWSGGLCAASFCWKYIRNIRSLQSLFSPELVPKLLLQQSQDTANEQV